MALDITALRTEFTDLHTKATTLVEKIATEKRDFTAEEKTENDAQTKRLNEIKTVLDSHKKLAGMAFIADNVEKPNTPPNKEDFNRADIVVGETFDKKPVKRDEFRKAMKHWANHGGLPKQFAAITTATQSGIFLPTEVDQPLTPSAPNTIRAALAAFGLDPMKTPSTAEINVPVADANSGSVLSESATTETENEPALTDSIVLKVKGYQSGSSWFSNTQLMALDYDLMTAVLPALAYSKELAMEADVFSTVAADTNITQITTMATLSAIAYDDLVNINMALPKRYSPQRVIVLNKNIYISAAKLQTSTGFPILNQDAQNQNIKSFNGTPVLWTDNFSTFGANNVVGAIWSWMGCRLRDAGEQELQRYAQYPLRPGSTGFNLIGRHCFGYAPHAVSLLKCPAS
jgi:HK97 family phage major capsid protein